MYELPQYLKFVSTKSCGCGSWMELQSGMEIHVRKIVTKFTMKGSQVYNYWKNLTESL